MAVDLRLVKKGKGEPIDGLVQQGRASLELAKKYAAELAKAGWKPKHTAALEASIAAVESASASKASAKTGAKGSRVDESSGIDGAKQFIRKLRHALPRAIREADIPGIDMATFAVGEALDRVTPRISAYLNKIRPSVEKLDDYLATYFDDTKATQVLDAVKAKLDAADSKQEVAWADLPTDTLTVYEAKGRLLELIEDMNRSGKIAFDGQADKIALFNKDILIRARKSRPAKGEDPAPGGGGGGAGPDGSATGGTGGGAGGGSP